MWSVPDHDQSQYPADNAGKPGIAQHCSGNTRSAGQETCSDPEGETYNNADYADNNSSFHDLYNRSDDADSLCIRISALYDNDIEKIENIRKTWKNISSPCILYEECHEAAVPLRPASRIPRIGLSFETVQRSIQTIRKNTDTYHSPSYAVRALYTCPMTAHCQDNMTRDHRTFRIPLGLPYSFFDLDFLSTVFSRNSLRYIRAR